MLPSPSASIIVQHGLIPLSKSSTYGNVEIGVLQSTTLRVMVLLLSLSSPSAIPLGLETVTTIVCSPAPERTTGVAWVNSSVSPNATLISLTVYSTASPPSTV